MRRLSVVLVSALVGFCASMAVVHGWRGQPLASSEARASWVPAQAVTKTLLGQSKGPSTTGLTFTSTAGNTVNGFACLVDGCRFDLGPGANDYWSALSGQVVTAAVIYAQSGVTIGAVGNLISSSDTGTATLDFASAAAGACSADLTITVTTATTTAAVALNVPAASVPAGSVFFAWVSAADTVSVRHCCINGTCDPASGSFRARTFNP